MPDPIIPAALSDSIQAKIAAASQSLPPAFQAIASAYAPAIVRLVVDNANADLAALYSRMVGLTTPTALDQIHALMTADELVAEKVALDPLFAKMAHDSYDAQQLGQQILRAALSAGISVALSAAGF